MFFQALDFSNKQIANKNYSILFGNQIDYRKFANSF